jgi:hypothetical protein
VFTLSKIYQYLLNPTLRDRICGYENYPHPSGKGDITHHVARVPAGKTIVSLPKISPLPGMPPQLYDMRKLGDQLPMSYRTREQHNHFGTAVPEEHNEVLRRRERLAPRKPWSDKYHRKKVGVGSSFRNFSTNCRESYTERESDTTEASSMGSCLRTYLASQNMSLGWLGRMVFKW